MSAGGVEVQEGKGGWGGVEVQEGKGECGWGRCRGKGVWVGWRCRRIRVSVGGVEVQEGKGECGWGGGAGG